MLNDYENEDADKGRKKVIELNEKKSSELLTHVRKYLCQNTPAVLLPHLPYDSYNQKFISILHLFHIFDVYNTFSWFSI